MWIRPDKTVQHLRRLRHISRKATNHHPITSRLVTTAYFGLGKTLIQLLQMLSISDTRLLSDTRLPIMIALLGNTLNRASSTSPNRARSTSLNLDTTHILQYHTKAAHT
jgi:hypothetical protein